MSLRTLNPLTLELGGIRLIEASAGTGKTHAIATLYLRLVLGAGGEPARRVQDILVVTFTRAATEELRERIRARLFEALHVLQGVLAGNLPPQLDADALQLDAQLCGLLQQIIDEARTSHCCTRLALELSMLDEAAIYTIHGFCQRALQDHAFDSQQAFDLNLLQDDTQHELAAVQDVWRELFYGDDAAAELARETFQSPARLYGMLRPLLKPGLQIRGDTLDAAGLRALKHALATTWRRQGPALVQELEESTLLSRRKEGYYLKGAATTVAAQVSTWIDGESLLPPDSLEMFGKRAIDDGRTDSHKKKGNFLPLVGPESVVDDYLDGVTKRSRGLLLAAKTRVQARLEAARRESGAAVFDDLITRLWHALTESPQRERLAAQLRQRFPVALIDEFQDTDPHQYAIFNALYGGDARDTTLILIGDPKQAIYSFRGADLHAYLGARRALAPERQYSLDTNWRSVEPLVDAVNHLFSNRSPAFLAGGGIPFEPMRASGNPEARRLVENGVNPVPLEFWRLPAGSGTRAPGKDVATEWVVAPTVARVAQLLQGATREGRRLKPREIGILVRTHRQGLQIEAALRARGIGSVMAGALSVFQTDEALALRDVLAAIIDRRQDRAVRRALAGSLLRRDAAFLLALESDSVRYESLLEQFEQWHATWLSRGFLPMFRQLLLQANEQSVCPAAQLLGLPDGERRLGNFLQLAELLQEVTREHASPEALLHWLEDQIEEPDGNADEQQLRLESDEDLVQVTTLHRSKGLQYPVVFLPFAWHTRRAKKTDAVLSYHEAGTLFADLSGSGEALARADLERLEEDLRLLYVGLTRAIDYCVVPWGRISDGEASALGYLLHGPDHAQSVADVEATGKGVTPERVEETLRQLTAARSDCFASKTPAEATADHAPAVPPAVPPCVFDLQARRLANAPQRAWRITSYSGLVRGAHEEARDVGNRQEVSGGEPPALTAFNLPGGTATGNLFHSLLETIDFNAVTADALLDCVLSELKRRTQPEAWAPVVAGMIRKTLATPLLADGFQLQHLPPARRRSELQFWFPFKGLSPAALDALVPLPAEADARSPLKFDLREGRLLGFIDLVFEHAGRWYVLDWKTNSLGASAAAYDRAGMAKAIGANHYDLQYTLYLLALHRHLAGRVPGYDPSRHLGGACYLFLRGMDPANGGQTGVWFDPPDLDRLDGLDALLRGASK